MSKLTFPASCILILSSSSSSSSSWLDALSLLIRSKVSMSLGAFTLSLTLDVDTLSSVSENFKLFDVLFVTTGITGGVLESCNGTDILTFSSQYFV